MLPHKLFISACSVIVITSVLWFSPVSLQAASNAVNISGNLTLAKDGNGLDTGIFFSNGTSQFSASPWSVDGFNIFYNVLGGKVGIGKAIPDVPLDVVGDTNVNGFLSVKKDDSPKISLMQQGGVYPEQTWDIIANDMVFRLRNVTNGKKEPLRISTGAPSYSFIISAEGFVGLGVPEPSQHLEVAGNIKSAGNVIAGSGMTGTPLAYGSFASTGEKNSGSPNLNCSLNGNIYYCAIDGESYNPNNYVAVATTSGGGVLFCSTDWDLTSQLIVRVFTLGAVAVQAPFHLVIYKP